MMNAIRMVWVISRHYNTDERMVPLMELIAGEIAGKVQPYCFLSERSMLLIRYLALASQTCSFRFSIVLLGTSSRNRQGSRSPDHDCSGWVRSVHTFGSGLDLRLNIAPLFEQTGGDSYQHPDHSSKISRGCETHGDRSSKGSRILARNVHGRSASHRRVRD